MGERICSIDGCGRTVNARGLCSRHYWRWWAYGDPLESRRSGRDVPDEDRFWPRIDVQGDCWIWTGSLRRGSSAQYGQFGCQGTYVPAHRWAYEFLIGPIAPGLHLDHLCRNPPCVNPDHLEPVTPRENARRGFAGARNRAKTHCANGHPFSPENTYKQGTRRRCRECQRAACRDYYHKKRALTVLDCEVTL